ncbi:hypothetical protein FACS189426_12770 [Bacteroidia bacterium]|nr:hypothetical protein FACS189426_12770 [Bacteroidia bacterium]
MKKAVIILSAIALIACTPKGEIPIEWADHLEDDFSFSELWNYGEAIFRNEYGQLICDGLCPSESYNMLDSEGRILEDSLQRYYQLVDTTHHYYTIVIDEWHDSLWYIHARQLNKDSIECFTNSGVSTYNSLKIDIVGNTCFPSVELTSPAPDSDWTYPCTGGSLKIDKTCWQKGIMKAVFRFTFYDEFGEVKNFTWRGRIYANIENYNQKM